MDHDVRHSISAQEGDDVAAARADNKPGEAEQASSSFHRLPAKVIEQ